MPSISKTTKDLKTAAFDLITDPFLQNIDPDTGQQGADPVNVLRIIHRIGVNPIDGFAIYAAALDLSGYAQVFHLGFALLSYGQH